MKALTARDALTESYLCVSSDGHPREFLNQVKDENVQACAVFENSTFLGLVDFKDILTCNPQRIFADLLPEPQAPPVQDDTPVQEVSRLLDRYRGNALPVLDKKSSFIGVISRDSLLYVLLQKHQHLLKLTKNVKDIVQTVNAVLDLKSMLRVALRKTLEMMGLKTGWLFLYNEEASMARLVTHVNLPRKYLKDHHALLRESCLCQSEVLNKKNEATVLCLKCVRGEKVTSDLKWHISIPLVSLAKPLGVMNLACRQEPCISNEELNLLTTLGKSIGTAIMNTQSFHKLEAERERLAQWSKRLSQLNKASTHLLSLLGTPILEDRLLQEGIETLCQLVEARYGVVGLFDADGKLVKLVHTGLTQAEAAQLEDLPKGMGILGALDQEQHVVRLRDVKKHPSFSGFPPNHPQMKSFLGMRIALKGKVHGRIYLTDKCGGRSFSKEDEKLVATFANSMALAIEHTHLMENLNRSEQRFRSVAQSASDAIISADSSGYIISWNNGARTIFGYQEEEVLGQPLTLLIPEWDRDAHEKGLKRMTSTGESHVIGKILELEGLRKDASVFPLELSVATWKTEEGTFYSGIIRDITERKR
ncbi:MAG: PAS domain S-box protein, partial [bacterium]